MTGVQVTAQRGMNVVVLFDSRMSLMSVIISSLLASLNSRLSAAIARTSSGEWTVSNSTLTLRVLRVHTYTNKRKFIDEIICDYGKFVYTTSYDNNNFGNFT